MAVVLSRTGTALQAAHRIALRLAVLLVATMAIRLVGAIVEPAPAAAAPAISVTLAIPPA
jgi:hypothetical protein